MSVPSGLPFELPKVSAKERARAMRLLGRLDAHWSHAKCELVYRTPHELLIATILSAQATDAGVNKVTPGLFKAYPTPGAFAAATPEEIEPYIKSIGLFRTKAKAVHSAMWTLVEKFGGEVPRTMEELLTLRGVARKTANVVLGNAFGINVGMPVDTHVQRLAVRFGLVKPGQTAEKMERVLLALFPRERWGDVSHMLIWHGRYVCKARGATCEGHEICREFGVGCECRTEPRA
ncbi:endonuclease III [bacterium]|nr:MAG: endonuclease III [bacterium]